MRFAVLGTDPEILALIAAARSRGHEIAWLGDVRPEDSAALAAHAPGLPAPSNAWEMLLDQATVDAVLVGRGMATAELRAEQLKRLATDAVPTLVIHPICDSVLTYYELDMIRRETRCILQHYNPLAIHPVLAEIAVWVRDGHPAIGAVHQVSCERLTTGILRDIVLARLARDAELLAVVAGDIRRASAVGPQLDASSFAALQVQMTTVGAGSLRWSVAPQPGAADAVELTLVGERGRITLHASDDAASTHALAWSLDERAGDSPHYRELPPFNAPAAAIDRLAAAIADTDAGRRAASSTWEKATQSMEVVDAIELSLQKGRTMDVHQQQLTEQLAFRGTMAALGCGLLLFTLGALVVAGFVGHVFNLGFVGPWPMIVLAALAIFLLLQTLPILVRRKPREQPPAN